MQFCKIITSFVLLTVIENYKAEVFMSQINGGEELDLLISEAKYVIALFCEYCVFTTDVHYTWQDMFCFS